MLGRALAIGRFIVAAVALPALLLLAAAFARPAVASVVAVAAAPSLGVDDGPFTRNQVVTLTIQASHLYPSPAVEWWASNDAATSGGQLVNGSQVLTGVGSWQLTDGADGPRTIYAQTKHADGTWSAVASTNLTLDTDPDSRVVFDLEPVFQLTNTVPDPVDWHSVWATPVHRILGQATTFAGGQSINVSVGGWGVTFASNTGPIAPGTYSVPAPGSGGSCGTSCAAVSRAFAGTCLGSGTFTVTEIAVTGDDDLATLDADYRLLCGTAVLAGSIRYGDTSDISSLDKSPFELAFGDTDLGSTSATQTVTITNDGDVPNTLGTAFITGGAAGDFAIDTDTCSGATLAVDATCTVSVEFSPTARAHRFSNLIVPDSTPREARRVGLGGVGWQPVTLDIEVDSLPEYGPAETTITVTAFDVGVDVTGPGLLIDGESPVVVSRTGAVLTGPLRSETYYVVELGPGTYELEGVFSGMGHAFYRDADPISVEVSVGTESWLELVPTTDDGVMLGESVDLEARLLTGGPVTGTLQIREGTDGPIVASQAVTGDAELVETVTHGLGSFLYTAAFVPTSPETQPAGSEHTVEVVDGPRPETEMDATPLASWAQVQTAFDSPTPGVTFECQSRLLEDEAPLVNFYPCTSPTWFLTNSKGWNVILVRSRLPNGLADRTPASRLWYFDWDLTGTTIIDGGATFSADATVTVSTVKPANAPSVTHVGLSNDGTTWTTRTYAASQPWSLVAGNGTRIVYTRWRDANGSWSLPATDSIILDTKAPTATAPAAAFVTGSSLGGGPIPVRLAWSGADNQSGVAKYQVSRSTDGGAWSVGSIVTAPAATITYNLSGNHTYRFRVRPTDKVGNVGAWVYGASFRLSSLQQTASSATYTGSWTTFASSTYWGGSVRASSSAGAKVRFTFTGTSFGWLTTMAPNRGKASIYVNGVYQGTVDLASATTKAKVVGWSKAWATSATRTVEIRVLGTAGRPRVDIDGFWTIR